MTANTGYVNGVVFGDFRVSQLNLLEDGMNWIEVQGGTILSYSYITVKSGSNPRRKAQLKGYPSDLEKSSEATGI